MTSKAISEVWQDTLKVFQKFNVPIIDKTLQILVIDDILEIVLTELNNAVGSSYATCIEGG